MPTLANMPTTWAEMNRWVHGTAPRTIANNTVAVRNVGDGHVDLSQPETLDTFSVYLHGHEIAYVTVQAVYVRDCGYVTTTTYDRLKRLLQPVGAKVYRKGGVGMVTLRDGRTLAVGDGYWTAVYA